MVWMQGLRMGSGRMDGLRDQGAQGRCSVQGISSG